MRKLGDLILPEGTRWEGWGNWRDQQVTTKKTTDGGVVVLVQPLSKGESIPLKFEREFAWLEYEQAQALWAMSKIVGATFLFEWDTDIEQVMILNVNLQPLQGIEEPEENYYIGSVDLITV